MKKTFTTITLALVLTFGATFANAGIIVGDRSDKGGIIVGDKAERNGIIVGDRAQSTCLNRETKGIIVGDFVGVIRAILGIIVGDKAETEPCRTVSKNGIIVGDRAGILIAD